MEAQTRAILTFTEIDDPWRAVVLVAVLAAGWAGVIWQYARERGALSSRARRGLVALRGAVWLMLVAALSGPALVPVETRRLPPEIVLLRDASQSMAARDAYEGETASRLAAALDRSLDSLRETPPTRAELMQRLFASARSVANPSSSVSRENVATSQTFWETLRSRCRIHVLDFSHATADSVATTQTPDDGTWPVWPTTGRATDLGTAIRAAWEVEGAAAAVLITDGQHSTRTDPREAARETARRGVPLLIVGVGSPRRPRDVRVASVYGRPHVWKSEPFDVESLLTFHVPDTTTVRLELIESRSADAPRGDSAAAPTSPRDAPFAPPRGNPPDAQKAPLSNTLPGTSPAKSPSASPGPESRVVQSVELQLNADSHQLVHRFSHRIDSPGQYSLAVRVSTPGANIKETEREPPSAAVRVLDKEQLRVLVVASEASWDFQQLERLLNREATVSATCWLQSADPEVRVTGNRPLERLPVTSDELDWYDVLLLLDPDPTRLPESWSDLVMRFAAEHSGGVLYAPGPRHAAEFLSSPVGLSLRRLLPVELPEGAELQLGDNPGRTEQAWAARVVPAQSDHPVLRLAGESAENSAIWERMPPLYSSFPVRDARPTSRTLLEHGDPSIRAATGPRPLLVVGQYRSAHAAFLGIRGIWRWRGRDGQEDWGDRLWLQLVRYLAEGRAWEGRRRGRLQTDRPQYEPGDRVIISLKLDSAATDGSANAAPSAQRRGTDGRGIEGSGTEGNDTADNSGERHGAVGTDSGATILARISEVESPVVLQPVAEQPGLYEGMWIARRAGQFTVTVPGDATTGDEATGDATTGDATTSDASTSTPLQVTFRVEPPQAESRALWLDEARLRELAELGNGRYFDAADLANVLEAIPDRRELVSTRRPAEPLWDSATVLIILAGLLSVEWTIRRRYKLV